jgi:hypothetical protein
LNTKIVAIIVGCFVAILVFGLDYYEAHDQDPASSAYRWYPNSSLFHPYVQFKAHWSKDAELVVCRDGAGGIWLEREIKIGDCIYWTRIAQLDRIDLKDYHYTNAILKAVKEQP